MAIDIFRVFQQHIDNVADFNSDTVAILELRHRDDSFRFVPNIDNDIGVRDLQYRPLHHFAFCEFTGAVLV